ncbi:hypothetical protein CEXT_83501 [Caerostris extrusa]|uniref:Uncharacterized protein n=1 Tax=Caerostris extrusa TaxID=172846 RepID=A0AAV4Q7L7_CAEEX|nr:hypothetical protein CEXT_83501 [Caerostris extrusa]
MEDSQVNLIFENAATLFGTVFHILEHLSKKKKIIHAVFAANNSDPRQISAAILGRHKQHAKSTNVAANITRNVSGKKKENKCFLLMIFFSLSVTVTKLRRKTL